MWINIAILALGMIEIVLFTFFKGFYRVEIIIPPLIILLLLGTGTFDNYRMSGWLLFFWILLLPTFGIRARTKCIKKLPPIFNLLWLAITAGISFSFYWFSRTTGATIQNVLSNSSGTFLFLLYPMRLLLPHILSPCKSTFDKQVSGELLQMSPTQTGIRIRSYALSFKGDRDRYIIPYNVGWCMRGKLEFFVHIIVTAEPLEWCI